MWAGFATAAATVAGLWEAVQVGPTPSRGVGGGLDAWDRRFSRELEALWTRPKKTGPHIRIREQEEDEEALAVLAMLGFTDI